MNAAGRLLSALLLAALTLSSTEWSFVRPAQAAADDQSGPHRAGLVVHFGDGKVETACVSFSEASISGEQLLERSPFKVILNPNSGFGGGVCSINQLGCNFPSQDCFCRCMGADCEYWAYYRWGQGSDGSTGWQYSQVGASGVQVQDGDLQGWSWGPGNMGSGGEPPRVALADVCKAGAAAATAAIASGGGSLAQFAGYAGYAAMAGLLLALGGLVLARRRRR